jgi:phosphopantetheinyl transferase
MTNHIWIINNFLKTTSSALLDPQVQSILSLYLPKNATIARTELGRPYAKSNGIVPDFNIAHSHDVLLLGMSTDSVIGVDIELIKKRPQQPKIAKRFFSKEEQHEDKFYLAWTAREAFVKALGLSVFSAFKRITIQYQDDGALIGLDNNFTHHVQFFSYKSSYVGAVCRERKCSYGLPRRPRGLSAWSSVAAFVAIAGYRGQALRDPHEFNCRPNCLFLSLWA